MTYDCTNDVRTHQMDVHIRLGQFSQELFFRGNVHDESKLTEPEKSCYDQWKPILEVTPFGTPEYDAAVKQMGEGLAAHFRNNSHHPEHYTNGIDGMNLFDLVEMYCDWMAVSGRKGVPLALDYLSKKFNLSPQLKQIIANTVQDNA